MFNQFQLHFITEQSPFFLINTTSYITDYFYTHTAISYFYNTYHPVLHVYVAKLDYNHQQTGEFSDRHGHTSSKTFGQKN